MIADSDRLEVLFRTTDEMEAARIAGVLTDEGIRSTTTGGYTLGLHAAAPGELRILVADVDLPLASKLLQQCLRERQPIDWDAVDFNDRTPVHADETAAPADSPNDLVRPPKLQFSLGTLVLIQTALCAAFALWHLIGGGETAAVLLVLLLFSLAVSGTIYIATHFGRVSDYW